MKLYEALVILLSCIGCGLIGVSAGDQNANRRFQQEAIAAGVAEWVTISDPFSSSKPVLEFRFRTPDSTR